jgi:hypothetical protein
VKINFSLFNVRILVVAIFVINEFESKFFEVICVIFSELGEFKFYEVELIKGEIILLLFIIKIINRFQLQRLQGLHHLPPKMMKQMGHQ